MKLNIGIKIVLFILCNPICLMAQNHKVDVIIDKIKHVINQPDSIEYFADMLRAIDTPSALAESSFAKGLAAFQRGQFEEAIAWYDQSLEYGIKTYDLQLRLLQNKAISYQTIGDYELAILWFRKLLGLAEREGDQNTILNALKSIGINYRLNKQYERSIEVLDSALESATENHIAYYHILAERGFSNNAIGNYGEAVVDFEGAIDLAMKGNFSSRIIELKKGLADAHEGARAYDDSNKVLSEIVSMVSDTTAMINYLSEMAENAVDAKKLEEAQTFFDKALKLAKNGASHMNGVLYLKLSLVARAMDDFQGASKYCDSSFYCLVEQEEYQKAASVATRQVGLYESLGDMQSSQAWQKTGDRLKDSVIDNDALFAEMKAAGVSAYFLESKSGINGFVLVFVSFLGAMSGFLFFRRRQKSQN